MLPTKAHALAAAIVICITWPSRLPSPATRKMAFISFKHIPVLRIRIPINYMSKPKDIQHRIRDAISFSISVDFLLLESARPAS